MAKRETIKAVPISIRGYGYIQQDILNLPMSEWEELQARCLSLGGSRAVIHGETFLRNKRGLLDYECYAVIPKARSDKS